MRKMRGIFILAALAFIVLSYQNCAPQDQFKATLKQDKYIMDRGGIPQPSTNPNTIVPMKEYLENTSSSYFMTAKSSDQQIVESNSAFKFTGVVFYIYANTKADFMNTSAIHRFYLPQNKDHFYTADEEEYSSIKNNLALASTFIDEGIEGSVLKYEKGATCPAGTNLCTDCTRMILK